MTDNENIIGQQLSLLDIQNKQNQVTKYVRKIAYDEAKPFLLKIHYARRMPVITDSFGLFINGEIVGVVTYGIPASNAPCIGIAGVENRGNVLELNRLVIRPGYSGKNYASYLVAKSLKMLPNKTFVVSYADTAWSHVGYVYQACNFLYTGLTAKRVDAYSPRGTHPRRHNKKDVISKHQTRSQKHRYVFLVGDKRTRRQMLKELRYKVYEYYPKGDERRYDTNNPVPVIPTRIVD